MLASTDMVPKIWIESQWKIKTWTEQVSWLSLRLSRSNNQTINIKIVKMGQVPLCCDLITLKPCSTKKELHEKHKARRPKVSVKDFLDRAHQTIHIRTYTKIPSMRQIVCWHAWDIVPKISMESQSKIKRLKHGLNWSQDSVFNRGFEQQRLLLPPLNQYRNWSKSTQRLKLSPLQCFAAFANTNFRGLKKAQFLQLLEGLL